MRIAAISTLLFVGWSLADDKTTDPFAPRTSDNTRQTAPKEPEDQRPSSDALKLLGEPALDTLPDAERYPAIRLIWIRTFHAPISLRAYLTKDGPRLRVARTSGKGGYDWGKLDFENDFPLKKEVWDQLLKLLYAEGARQPFKKVAINGRDLLSGLDGAVWKLEVADKEGYSVDEAWSPTSYTDGKPEDRKILNDHGIQLDNFVKLCKFLIQYAPIDPESIY